MMTNLSNSSMYQALFEHSSIGIIISDHTGIIRQINPHASQIFGYAPNELVGKKIDVLVPKPIRPRHADHRNDFNKAPRARPMGIGMNLSAVKKSGQEFPVEISLASYETEGQRHVVSFVNDITERQNIETALQKLNKELEDKVGSRTEELSQTIKALQQTNDRLIQEMKQRRRAEEEALQALEKEKDLSELKSRFVSMASHEFRTPLAGILTSVSLITRHIQDGNLDKTAKHVQTVKDSVQSLTTILNDFLSLDKLEEGRVALHLSTFDLEAFAIDLSEEMQSLTKKAQQIHYQHQGERAMLCSDKQLLKNILINLLSNAIKYSPEGSQIYLTTVWSPERVMVQVQDQGIGIPQNEQKHLFERFFRAHNASAIQGTGLGLHIVQRYLSLLGGTIGYKSEENAGTTFTVSLPVSNQSE